jgi:hypothetical protein
MILLEFTPAGGTLQRLSTEDIALEYQWFGYILAMSSVKFQLPTKHGGFAAPSFSEITISPELMEELGEYPATADALMIETDTDENGGTEIYQGTARLETYDRYGFTYNLKQPELPDVIAESTAYNDTLVNVVASICTTLGLTLNSTNARATSPAVLHTTSSEQLAIDLLSDMCSFFSHGFTIAGTTLYLFDMLGVRTKTTLTEFDVQPCEYRKDTAYSLYKATDTETLAGADENGEEYSVEPYHTTGANIQTALADIKTIMEQDIATIRFKVDETKPKILDQIILLDESLILPVTTTGTITSIIYNFDTLAVEVEVAGSVTT